MLCIGKMADRVDQQGFEEANADSRQALELDPGFARAAEALVETLNNQVIWDFMERKSGDEQIRRAAELALRLDPSSGVGRLYRTGSFDYGAPSLAAREDIKAALRLSPKNPTILLTAMRDDLSLGDWSGATQLLNEALSVDPLNANAYYSGHYLYLRVGRYREAEKAVRRMLEISPSYANAHYYLVTVLLLEGRKAEALDEAQKETWEDGKAAALSLAMFAVGRKQESDSALEKLEQLIGNKWPSEVALVHTYRGEADEALRWLDHSLQIGDPMLRSIVGDPYFQKLEDDPSYQALLRKLNPAE